MSSPKTLLRKTMSASLIHATVRIGRVAENRGFISKTFASFPSNFAWMLTALRAPSFLAMFSADFRTWSNESTNALYVCPDFVNFLNEIEDILAISINGYTSSVLLTISIQILLN